MPRPPISTSSGPAGRYGRAAATRARLDRSLQLGDHEGAVADDLQLVAAAQQDELARAPAAALDHDRRLVCTGGASTPPARSARRSSGSAA